MASLADGAQWSGLFIGHRLTNYFSPGDVVLRTATVDIAQEKEKNAAQAVAGRPMTERVDMGEAATRWIRPGAPAGPSHFGSDTMPTAAVRAAPRGGVGPSMRRRRGHGGAWRCVAERWPPPPAAAFLFPPPFPRAPLPFFPPPPSPNIEHTVSSDVNARPIVCGAWLGRRSPSATGMAAVGRPNSIWPRPTDRCGEEGSGTAAPAGKREVGGGMGRHRDGTAA